MNTQAVVLVAVLLHVSAGRGLSVKSRNGEHQLDAGDGYGMKRVSEESGVSDQDLDAGDLAVVKESVGNDLHDIRRREARSRKRSSKRQGDSGDESGTDQTHEPGEKVVLKGVSDFLEPKKEMIINFMRPIIDRIKNKLKKPGVGKSLDSAAPSTPAPSATPSDSDASTSSDSDASGSSDTGTSDSSDSDASGSSDTGTSDSSESDASDSSNSKPSDSYTDALPFFHSSSSKCGENERHRSMNTLSLLFPDLESNKGDQPFVFVPLTNTLMRVVEQQIIRESRSGGEMRRRLQNLPALRRLSGGAAG